MNQTRLVMTAALLFFIILSGCKETAKAQRKPPVAATVNGVPIMADEVALRLGGHDDLPDQAAKEKAIKDVIAEELLYQKAVKLGFDKDEKFQGDIRKMEMKIMAYKRAEMGRRVRDTKIASQVNVTEGEVEDYYAKHLNVIGTDLRLGVLRFSDPAKAKEALARINSGTAFEKIAVEEFAHAPKGSGRDWDKGFLHWEQIPAAFADDVYRLKKGEVSDVLSSGPVEIYLVKVVDRRKNPAADIGRVKTVIENRLWSIKGKEAYERYIQQLKREASIKEF